VTSPLGELHEQDIARIRALKNTVLTPMKDVDIEVTVFSQHVILDHYWQDKEHAPWNDFPMVPVYAKKRGKKWVGQGRSADRDSNRWEQGRIAHSDYALRANANPTFITNDTFHTPAEAEKFKQYATSPGGVYTLKGYAEITAADGSSTKSRSTDSIC